MGKAQEIQQETYRSFPVYVAAGLVYLGLTLAVVFAFKRLEKRYLTHLKPRAH
jgi:ABC-type arginine/histidine transport system permease subunit